ncbi:MAG: hypothetical protein K2I96_09635 [Lachnospiraceae bacterium]|nr:hypothetical protein [Lachnospiraceae bacterium]
MRSKARNKKNESNLQKKNCRGTKDKSITLQKSFCKAFDKTNAAFGNLQTIRIEDVFEKGDESLGNRRNLALAGRNPLIDM